MIVSDQNVTLYIVMVYLKEH